MKFKYCFLFVQLIFCVYDIKAQTFYNYRIDTFSSPYDTLVDFNSIPKELVADMDVPWSSWSRNFPLEFSFPFFDTMTTELVLENFSTGIMPGSTDYNLFLFNLFWGVYTKDLELEDFTSDRPLQSDFRYNHVTKNNKKAFVMEYKNVGFDPRYDEDFYTKGKVSFQTWFWENGDIELRFGEVNLDGLFFNGKIPDISDSTYIFLFIRNALETKHILIEGEIEKYNVVTNFDTSTEGGILKSLPHKNFVFRFKYMPSATNDVQKLHHLKSMTVYNKIEDENFIGKHYSIYNSTGALIQYGRYDHCINVEQWPKGIYALHLQSNIGQKIDVVKMIKL